MTYLPTPHDDRSDLPYDDEPSVAVRRPTSRSWPLLVAMASALVAGALLLS